MESENIQMTSVLTESRTIRVVAESSLVTLTPAKLKNEMEMMLPGGGEGAGSRP